MKKKICLLILLIMLGSAGCAAKWSLDIETPTAPMQWRDDANAARATYVETIKGFRETGTTVQGALKSFVFGSSKSDDTINRPVAVAIGHDGRLAIADMGCACVHLYVPSEKRYEKLYGTRKEELRTPVGVAFDDDLKLFVSDSSRGAIYLFDREGEPLTSIKSAGKDLLKRPTGLSYSAVRKTLYAVDTVANKVYAFNDSGALLFSFGERGDQKGQFNYPTHIIASPQGRVYVNDAMNFRIQVFDPSGAFISSFGHHGNGSGDFSLSKGIAVDPQGVIYVVDNLFDNIQLFNGNGGFLFTIGGRGDGAGEFWLPSGLTLDDRGKLYVCDTYNHRIQVIQINRGDVQ